MEQPERDEQAKVRGFVASARWFGEVAGLYDKARPSYPAELVSDLLASGPADIVDVGCGTGKAARLFAGRDRRVLGVEPDPGMAAVARANGVDVEVDAFETWDDAGRQFDLLISATAWHWVDPVAGAAKAAKVLKPGGRFAAFWNAMQHSAQVRSVFAEVYGRHAPQLLATSFALGAPDPIDRDSDLAGQALAAGPFRGVTPGERRQYAWSAEYTPQGWADVVATHSDHRLLDPPVKDSLLEDLAAALMALGPTFSVSMQTDLLQATRC
jgi:SAM-dependent methyltransferase